MRKLITTLALLFVAGFGFGQATCVFHEDMDNIDSLTANPSGNPGWAPDPTIAWTGLQSNLGTYSTGTTSTATSIQFSTVGYNFVILKFWQIAKIEFFDQAIIQVSTDGGNTWTQLTGTNSVYQGGSPGFISQGNKFTEAAYPDWAPGQSIPPDPFWWKEETFDVSALLGNQANCMVRFLVSDLNNTGMGGRYGWLLDDICVLGAPCELNPPVVNQINPILTNTVYNLGPYTLNITADDASGIDTVWCYYDINSTGVYTAVPMTLVVGDTFTCQLPAVNVGDLVCYYFYVTDAAAPSCFNSTTTISNCFVSSTGISPTYCDDFEVNNLWTPLPVLGSNWELGTPAYGATNSTHSGANAWDIDLFNQYQPSTETYVISPVMDFSQAALTELNFWHNYVTENNWDGTRIDYSFDLGTTWNVLDPDTGTMYDLPSLISSGLPGWCNNSNGWKNLKALMPSIFDFQANAVQLRFAFTSDASVQYDGYSFDDFCLIKPADDDMGALAFVQPTVIGAALDTVLVKVTVRNFGLQPQSNFNVYYQVDANPPHGPFAYTGAALIAGQQADVECDSLEIPSGQYNICAWTDLVSDANHFNDTTCQASSGVPKVQITYCNDFDSNPGDWTPIASGNGDNWEVGTPAFGQTNSAYSQPNAWDVNLFTGYQANTKTELLSPIFDMTQAVNARMTFRQNYNIYQFGDGTHMEYSLAGGPWQTLGQLQVNDPNAIGWYNYQFVTCLAGGLGWTGTSNGWQYAEYNMSQFNTSSLLQIKFVFCSNTFAAGFDGHSIDNFCIIDPPADDVGVISVDQPIANGQPAGDVLPVAVTIKNYGKNNESNFPVSYRDPVSLAINSTTFTGTLTPNATASVTFPQTFTVPPSGAFDICAWTELSTDGDHTNDSTCRGYVSIPTLTPAYPSLCDDFEGGNNGWSVNTTTAGSQWELGTPSTPVTNSAHSGVNCWDINLSTNYGPSAETKLYTPFYDFANAASTVVSLWLNYNTEQAWDGVQIEWDTAGTGNWQVVGVLQAPGNGSNNWYNVASQICSQKPGWGGNSGGWIFAYDSTALSVLDNASGKVQFRFPFCSDASVQIEGFSIDDFCLTVPIAITAAALDVYPNPPSLLLTPGFMPVVGRIGNKGSSKLTSVVAEVYADGFGPGNLVSRDTIFFPGNGIGFNKDTLHTFQNQWNASSGAHTLCLVTSWPNATNDQYTPDDTTCSIVTVFDSTSNFPSCADFESGYQWVTLNAKTFKPVTTSWQLGLPNKPNINSTHSGAKCWVTNLTGNYQSPDTSALFTPIFNIQQGQFYNVKFWHNYVTDIWNDGGTFEFSTDTGKTWHPLGYNGDPSWYNTYYMAAFGGPPPISGWTGNSNGWVYAEHCLYGYQTGQLMLRFNFGSDNSLALDGWAIDDFCFESNPAPCAQSVVENGGDFIWLDQNMPNPANDLTEIAFSVPKTGMAELTITNLMGQQIATVFKGEVNIGRHTVKFNTSDLSSGIYYYALKFDGKQMVRKMVIAK